MGKRFDAGVLDCYGYGITENYQHVSETAPCPHAISVIDKYDAVLSPLLKEELRKHYPTWFTTAWRIPKSLFIYGSDGTYHLCFDCFLPICQGISTTSAVMEESERLPAQGMTQPGT